MISHHQGESEESAAIAVHY